jgi:hypothetical protein
MIELWQGRIPEKMIRVCGLAHAKLSGNLEKQNYRMFTIIEMFFPSKLSHITNNVFVSESVEATKSFSFQLL